MAIQYFKHIKCVCITLIRKCIYNICFENVDKHYSCFLLHFLRSEKVIKLSLLPGVLMASVASAGRKREWFKVEEAIKVLQYHKPVQASYLETLRQGYSANNGTPVMATTCAVSSSQNFTGIR